MAQPRLVMRLACVLAMAAAGCGAGVDTPILPPGQSVSTFPPLPPDRQHALVALQFLEHAQRGEDVSDLVVDEVATGPGAGDRAPAPQRPAEVASQAQRLKGLGATFENATVLSLPQTDGTIREYVAAGFGPGCSLPADVYVICSVIVRNSYGRGLINVSFLSRTGQTNPLVADFQIVQPLPAFTG